MHSEQINATRICQSVLNSLRYILVCTLVSACATAQKPSQDTDSANADVEITSDSNAASAKERSTTSETESLSGTSNAMPPPQPIADPLAGNSAPAALRKVYAEVAAYNQQKDFAKAEAQLHAEIKKTPNAPGLYYLLAKTQFLAGKYAEAKQSAQQSIKLLPGNYYSWNLLGVIERSQGNFKDAKSAYEKAIAIYPGYPASYKNLAILADIYLRDLKLALANYLEYQALVGDADKKLKGWIKDLERRIKAQGGQ